MQPITIYTTMFCPYCHLAKRLLTKKGAEFTEIDVTMRPNAREEMTRLAGGGAPYRRSSSARTMSAAATSFTPWMRKVNWTLCLRDEMMEAT